MFPLLQNHEFGTDCSPGYSRRLFYKVLIVMVREMRMRAVKITMTTAAIITAYTVVTQ